MRPRNGPFGLLLTRAAGLGDIAIGVPTLLIWQVVEGHRMVGGARP